jgi:Cu/Ag efflux protein CusF
MRKKSDGELLKIAHSNSPIRDAVSNSHAVKNPTASIRQFFHGDSLSFIFYRDGKQHVVVRIKHLG